MDDLFFLSQWKCVTSRIVLRALKQMVLKTHQDKQDNFTKLVGTSSLTNTVVGYHGLCVTVVLVVTQNVLQLPGRRSYRRFRPRPWRSVPCWPSPTACDHSQGVALPNRLTHAAGPFVTGRPRARSLTVRTHSVLYRPAGREVERRAIR